MKHWTEEEFEHWIYGVREPDEHLASCSECRAESERLVRLRRRITAEPEVSHEFLAVQRRQIYARVEQPVRAWLSAKWMAPIALMAIMLAFTLTLLRPEKPAQPLYTHADEQLFSDLSRIEQSSEPQAIEPIHNLFQ